MSGPGMLWNMSKLECHLTLMFGGRQGKGGWDGGLGRGDGSRMQEELMGNAVFQGHQYETFNWG